MTKTSRETGLRSKEIVLDTCMVPGAGDIPKSNLGSKLVAREIAERNLSVLITNLEIDVEKLVGRL